MKTILAARHRICCPFGRFLGIGLALLMVAVISACANTTAYEGRPRVVLYGGVRSSAGVPVAGATVAIRHYASPCGSGIGEIAATTTNNAGRYREELTVFTSADGCVRINVTATGFAPDSATVTSVPFRQPPALDSVETNFVLVSR